MQFLFFLVFGTCLDCIKVLFLDFGFVIQATGDFGVDSADFGFGYAFGEIGLFEAFHFLFVVELDSGTGGFGVELSVLL